MVVVVGSSVAVVVRPMELIMVPIVIQMCLMVAVVNMMVYQVSIAVVHRFMLGTLMPVHS